MLVAIGDHIAIADNAGLRASRRRCLTQANQQVSQVNAVADLR